MKRLGWSEFTSTWDGLVEPVEVTFHGRVKGTYTPAGHAIQIALNCDHDKDLAAKDVTIASLMEQLRAAKAEFEDWKRHRSPLTWEEEEARSGAREQTALERSSRLHSAEVRFGVPRAALKPAKQEPKRGWGGR